MKLILSPWAFLPFHFGISFPLNKWTGSGVVQLIMLIINMAHYIDEHWTRAFPNFSGFAYAHHLNDIPQQLQYYAMFYFSYYNCGKNKHIVRRWFVATLAFQAVVGLLGNVGMPMPTVEEQIAAIENSEVYNIAHLVGHCFTFVMAWHVSSVVDVSNGLKNGRLIDRIKRHLDFTEWNGAALNSFHTMWWSIAVCIGTAFLAFAIEAFEEANDGSVPMFPPMCKAVVGELDKCTFLGITIPCFKVFNKDTVEHFGMGMEMSAIWTFVVTFLIGVVSMWLIVDDMNHGVSLRHSSLKITCAIYAMETAFFALIRYYWGVCKPLVVAAAVHNLCEWSIVLHYVSNYEQLGRYLPSAGFFIAFLCTLCICIPSLYLSLGLEQVLGIMLDFGMPLMGSFQLFDERKREIYWMPALAHTVHLFGTIIPLVFGILLSTHVSWFSTFFLEIIINVTVPANHFLYCLWSFRLPDIVADLEDAPPVVQTGRRFTTIRLSWFDDSVNEGELEDKADGEPNDVPRMIGSDGSSSSSSPARSAGVPEGTTPRMKYTPAAPQEDTPPASPVRRPSNLVRRRLSTAPSVRWNLVPSAVTEDDDSTEAEDDEGAIPKEYRINKVGRYLIIGFLLGVFTIGYVPLVYMPDCDAPPCLTRRHVSKTSILTASEESLASSGTVAEAKQSLGKAGLLELKLERAVHDVAADKFVLVEKWRSEDNMTATEETFPRVIGAARLEQLDVASVQTMTCPHEMIKTIQVQMQPSCKQLWRVLDEPGYCAWIPGCKVVSTDNLSPYSQLFMSDGETLPAVFTKKMNEKNYVMMHDHIFMKKDMKISVSVLSQRVLPGYSAELTLSKPLFGKGCELKYESRINIASLSVSAAKRSTSFHEYFLPDLYTKLSQK